MTEKDGIGNWQLGTGNLEGGIKISFYMRLLKKELSKIWVAPTTMLWVAVVARWHEINYLEHPHCGCGNHHAEFSPKQKPPRSLRSGAAVD